MKKTILTTLLVLFLVSIASYIFILYGKGYRLDLTGKGNKIVAGTGLLVITSTPNGARAYINDNLTTATDDTLNLPPGEYDIRIEKDGYYPWKKHVILKKEAVTKTDAVLFPTTPKLEATTFLGAKNPIVDGGGNFIEYQVSSSSAKNNGIYILSINRPFLSLGSSSKQLVSDSVDEFSNATVQFSPDGLELLATIKTSTANKIYLLKTDVSVDNPQNVTFTVGQVRLQWDELKIKLEEKLAKSLPQASRAFILANFSNMKFSSEGDKILYIASESAQMPNFIVPSLPSTNSTPEMRNLTKGSAYVYQIKEDKNYLFYSSEKTLPQFIWYPSSAHIIFIEGKRIVAMEYDGGNKTTLYSGPFDSTFVYPWPDSSGLIIETNLNDETVPANLYKVGLR